jgi:hypothetical protein
LTYILKRVEAATAGTGADHAAGSVPDGGSRIPHPVHASLNDIAEPAAVAARSRKRRIGPARRNGQDRGDGIACRRRNHREIPTPPHADRADQYFQTFSNTY